MKGFSGLDLNSRSLLDGVVSFNLENDVVYVSLDLSKSLLLLNKLISKFEVAFESKETSASF